MKEEGKNLHQIIQQLEMRYGSLTTVADARIRCNNMPRKPDETIPDFADRLRLVARMACRGEMNEPLRRRAMDVLVEGNIRRVLPSSVRNALEERINSRNLMGLPALSAREIEADCLELENRRSARKLELKAAPMAQVKRHNNINRAEAEVDYVGSSSESSEEEPAEDDPQEYLINQIAIQKQKYFQRGRPANGPKVLRKAFNDYNNKFYGQGKNAPYGARQAAGGEVIHPAPRQQGPPNKMDGPGFKPIYELLALANCQRGQCIQCGNDGHIMRNPGCALKDRPLTDRVCAKCGKGLHSADDCPKVFQQDFKAPAPAAQVITVEPLNEK
jgi:hypothetical protein